MRGQADADLPTILLTGLTIFIILLVGVQALSLTADTTASDDSERVTEPALLDGTQYTNVDSGFGTNETVYDSLGYAVNLTGATDSYTESTSPIDATSGNNWTVSTWARVDSASSAENMTVLSLNGRLVITYNGSATEWRAWYYDDGERTSHQVAVNAPDQPSSWANIIVTLNDSTDRLTIYRNATEGENATITTASTTPAPNTTNFDGRKDETRTFGIAANSTVRNAIYTDAVGPRPGTDRTARIMYDEAGEDRQLLFFSGGDVLTYNATYSDGLDGAEMTEDSLLSSGDYVWRNDGPEIRAVSGGELDGAPVAYVVYDQASMAVDLVNDWGDAAVLAGLIPILLIVGYIVTQVQSSRR